jgi:hypothetical protein
MPPRRSRRRSRRASPRRYRGDGLARIERYQRIDELTAELLGLGIQTLEPTPRAAYDNLGNIARGRQIVQEMQALLNERVPEELRASIDAMTTAYVGIANMLEALAKNAKSVAAAAGA